MELLERIHQKDADLPVILITGHGLFYLHGCEKLVYKSYLSGRLYYDLADFRAAVISIVK